MVNLIDTINSKFGTVPSTDECIKMLNEYISDDIKRNHSDVIKCCSMDTVNNLRRNMKNLFINCYVNKGYNGSYNKELHDVIMKKLPMYHQCLLLLSEIYITSREMRIYG